MRLTLLVLCLWSAVATAGPLPRKRATDTYPLVALQQFAEAVAFEHLGQYGEALASYFNSSTISPQPNTYFNLGRMYLEFEDRAEAIEAFEKYLELAPAAPDRAAVATLVADLRAAKPRVAIGAATWHEPPDAVVLVDGELIGRSPVVVELTPGTHVVERITRTTYGYGTLEVAPGTTASTDVFSRGQTAPGNVLISVPPPRHIDRTWQEGAHTFVLHQQFTLPVGTYTTRLAGPVLLCQPVKLTVPATDVITYVQITLKSRGRGETCDTVTRVRTHQIDLRGP